MQVEEIVKLKINVIEESSWRVQNTEFEREEQVKKYLRRLSRLLPSTLYTGRAVITLRECEKKTEEAKTSDGEQKETCGVSQFELNPPTPPHPGLPDFGLLREECWLRSLAPFRISRPTNLREEIVLASYCCHNLTFFKHRFPVIRQNDNHFSDCFSNSFHQV